MRVRLIVAATLIFSLLGAASIGCVAFGVIEIAKGDAIFLNDGLGEVLTVLGTYFMIPYLFIFGTFLVSSLNVNCNFLGRDLGVLPQHVMLVMTLLMMVLQQVVTDIYLALLQGNASLAIILGDVAVLSLFVYYRLNNTRPGMAYTLLFMCKMAVLFGNAYKTVNENFFGPNGILAMLFMCIPIVQFPLYVAGTWETKRSVDLVDVFVGNFNLYLSHLLHSLDIISMYNVAFLLPETNANQVGLPAPFKVLIGFAVCIGFLSNNLSVLHLFYERRGMAEAEIVILPQAIRDIARSNGHDGRGGGGGGGSGGANGGANGGATTGHDAVRQSHERRIFQYMIFMLVVCDVPFLIARMELWRKQYAPLSIFVAKNLKDIADVAMLVKRVDPPLEPGGPGSAPATATVPAASRALFSLGAHNRELVSEQRDPLL